MKKMRKKNVKHKNVKTRVLHSINPRIFFKQIGIKPLVKPNEAGTLDDIEKWVVKKFGNVFFEKMKGSVRNYENNLENYHSNLDLVKIWYGVDFNRICNMASQLTTLNMPENSSILDVGGGPGHLSFWMANIWNPASVTVADINTNVGPQWAKEMNENRVNFVKSRLPELNGLEDQKFDAIILSRILCAMSELDLPDYVDDFQNKEVQRIHANLEKIGNRLRELVESQGQVIVIDSWSDHRILLVGKAFEKAGLFMDLQRFNPLRVGLEPSIIVFSKSIEPVPLKDLIYSLSTTVQFPPGPPKFSGTAAESLRVLFGDGEIRTQFESESNTREEKVHTEIVEKEGLILVFRSDNIGSRAAWIFPGIYICEFIRRFDELKSDLISDL
jgi:2-polyprenyl-3-methyl-5-hydroxy-6-metoxy-1,4-benzoquinol methylase